MCNSRQPIGANSATGGVDFSGPCPAQQEDDALSLARIGHSSKAQLKHITQFDRLEIAFLLDAVLSPSVSAVPAFSNRI
jgi:hypothetical protein